MSSVLSCASHVLMKAKKKGEKLSPEKKQAVYNKVMEISKNWQTGAKYKNVKDAQYNTIEVFERIYEEATGFSMDPVESVIPNLKDLRKVEIRLEEFNSILGTKDGAVFANLKLPRRILMRLPELDKFQQEITSQSSFFRKENVDNNLRINDILRNFKKFSGSLGSEKGDYRAYSQLEARLEPIIANKRAGKKFDQRLYTELRNKKAEMLNNGAGTANLILSEVFQGRSIKDLREQYKFGSQEEALLNNMKREYNEVRKSTSVNLIRGLQKLISISKDSDTPGIEKILEDIKNRIKEIEFQKVGDERDNPIRDSDFFKADAEMQAFGFTTGDRYTKKVGNQFKVANRQYMPQFVLGIPKILAKVEKAIRGEPVEGKTRDQLLDNIKKEVEEFGGIIDHAKGRSVADSEYSLDPFMFLNKYVGDVSLFNYKIHVKDSFKRAYDTLVNQHMKPATLAGNETVAEALDHHLRVATDVYNAVKKLDPGDTVVSDNIMRTISALTYFRLLGGNIRSAFRNGTQRVYELNKWGWRGLSDARKFYTEAGGTENTELANKMAKEFGILWFEGKEVGSTIIDAFKGKGDLSSASRGALQESFFTGKGLKVSAEGEIVRSTDGISDIVARGASSLSDKAAFAHKIVEDWNRARTFRMGFAIAYKNLQNMSPEWISRKSKINLSGEGSEVKIKNWMAREAGQIAYNSVLDIHYEYANWAKAKALQGGKGVKAKAGTFLGQFMHYRFSNFDMMYNWYDKAKLSAKAGDFTSESMFTMMRLGITQGIINNIFAPLTNIRTDSVLNNDVAETADAAYSWFTTDRDDPEAMKKLEKKTYGQGGYYFLGPNVGFLLSLAEVKNFREMDKDSHYRDDLEFVDDRVKQYKTLSLINSQLARSWVYSVPLLYERGLIDSMRLDLGLFPDQDIRDIRDWAKKWVGKNLHPTFKADWMKYNYERLPKSKQPGQNSDAALQALALLT